MENILHFLLFTKNVAIYALFPHKLKKWGFCWWKTFDKFHVYVQKQRKAQRIKWGSVDVEGQECFTTAILPTFEGHITLPTNPMRTPTTLVNQCYDQ